MGHFKGFGRHVHDLYPFLRIIIMGEHLIDTGRLIRKEPVFLSASLFPSTATEIFLLDWMTPRVLLLEGAHTLG